MKHFIIAVILLLAVVALTTINALTIVRRMEDFQTRLEGLPETEADAAALDPARLDELYDEWSSLRRFIALSTHLSRSSGWMKRSPTCAPIGEPARSRITTRRVNGQWKRPTI